MATAEKIKGFYFGRFQPPLEKHAILAHQLSQDHPEIQITVGIADNQVESNQNNFLSGHESQYLFQVTCVDLGLLPITTALVPLYGNRSFEESVKGFFSKLSLPEAIVFSGSSSTIRACESLARDHNLTIVRLDDDDTTGPRARHIRNGLIHGTDGWHQLVTPTVFQYLTQPEIVQRIRALPNGEKRPWTKAG